MGGEFGRCGLDHAIAEPGEVQAFEQRLAPSEQDGRDRDVQLVDEAGLQVLADRGVETPPPILTSRSPTAARARSSTAWMPSTTKWKVVPPSIAIGARGWCVSMNVGAR